MAEARKPLLHDLSEAGLQHTRVSVAVARREFATNEKGRRNRLIEEGRLNTWWLKQRDRGLDGTDDEM